MNTNYADAVLTIDPAALQHNYRLLAKKAGTAITASVVKADGYGLGIAHVAPVLHEAGCRDFFVANLDEAIELRALVPDAAIYVFHGIRNAGQAAIMLEHNLTPELNSEAECTLWQQQGQGKPAILHVDTGMTRLGVDMHALETLDLSGINLCYIMSHLACMGEPDHPLNATQKQAAERLRTHFPTVPLSIANSGGVATDGSYHHDMVRVGCSLYGINSVPTHILDLQQVAKLEASIIQLRTLQEDTPVGYGATEIAKAGSVLATVPVGYADGYLRSLSNKGAYGSIKGVEVPLVGRVSMDLLVLDVTHVPDIQLGDKIELLGPNVPVDMLAEKAGTIGYEVLTRLGSRFKRELSG